MKIDGRARDLLRLFYQWSLNFSQSMCWSALAHAHIEAEEDDWNIFP
jgi:hypothetical protein